MENLDRERGSEVRGKGVAMDTPEKSQIRAPISEFEDSPVFNYINNLSPIKPVKSIHLTQSFNSLSFASLPSIFTSPHVSSLKDSRCLRRHQLADLSRPEFSSENGSKVDTNGGITSLNLDFQQEHLNVESSAVEASVEPPYECSKLAVELSQTLSYDCDSPECKPTPGCDVGTKFMPELVGTSNSRVLFVQEDFKKGLSGSERHTVGISQHDRNEESAGFDWEGSISDPADLLNFESLDGSEACNLHSQKSLDSRTKFCVPFIHDLQKTKAVGEVGVVERIPTENSSQFQVSGDPNELDENQDIPATSLNNCTNEEPSGKLDDETIPNVQRGMRRRCLVFEKVGCRRKCLSESSSGCGSYELSQSDERNIPNDLQLVPLSPGKVSFRGILPGIGLHLNALALTSKEQIIKNEALASGRQLLNSTASLQSVDSGLESFAGTSSERELDSENGFPVLGDAPQSCGQVDNEEFIQSSPKRKRRKVENEEGQACKRCHCKKSKCLKLYCECFAAGVYCMEPCSCQGCMNKPIHEDTVLATRKQIESRNPLAFAPKVIWSSESAPEIGDELSNTPASARHKRGCNCKKSGCLKKYCECYQGGVGCSINCRCEGCKNAFGRKDGFLEAELGEEETETCERKVAHQRMKKTDSENEEEENPDSVPPATPSMLISPSAQMPYSSKSKPPRRSFFTIGSSGLYANRRLGKPGSFQPQYKFQKQFQSVPQDEMPEILQGNCSPNGGIKSSSPNSKRVSPPHCEKGLSPGWRSTRKLILQSIPSFPSLTPKQ